MTDFFKPADRLVIGLEGVHGNQAGDPGGDTWYGIARTFHFNETPWPPSWDRAQEIRRTEYWLAHHCDQMPWCWALGVYDAEVNQPGGGIRSLQAELGVSIDGVVGLTETLPAILRAGPDRFSSWMARRIVAYSGQPLWDTDGKGWARRALDIHHAALIPPQA